MKKIIQFCSVEKLRFIRSKWQYMVKQQAGVETKLEHNIFSILKLSLGNSLVISFNFGPCVCQGAELFTFT